MIELFKIWENKYAFWNVCLLVVLISDINFFKKLNKYWFLCSDWAQDVNWTYTHYVITQNREQVDDNLERQTKNQTLCTCRLLLLT